MTTADEARTLLATVDSAARATRDARPTRALPLLVLGLVVLGALPFYVLGDPVDGVYEAPLLFWALGGSVTAQGGIWTGIYWFVALPAAYVFIAWWCRRAGRRAGVAVRVAPLAVAGIGLLILLVAILTQSAVPIIGDLAVRGLTPLLPIAAGLVVWAIAERSRGLAVVSVVYTAAAISACLYDWANVLPYAVLDGRWEYSLLPNLLLCAGVLLGSAAVYAVLERRGARA